MTVAEIGRAWRSGLRAGVSAVAVAVGVAFAHACAVPLSGGCSDDGTCPVEAADGDAADADVGSDAGVDAVVDSALPALDAGADVVVMPVADAHDAAPACDPTHEPKDDPCVLDDSYGVFVDSQVVVLGVDAGVDAGGEGGRPDTSATAAGSKAHPYSTIGQAVAHLGSKKRIYVCNGAYREEVRLSAPVSLFGGLSCASSDGGLAWAYVGASAQVTAPSPTYALTVTAQRGSDAGVDAGVQATADGGPALEVTIEDMAFTAPGATLPGASSVAAFVDSATVHFARVALSAGPGADGPAGADGNVNPNFAGAAPGGSGQVLGTGANAGVVVAPGSGGVNGCLRYGGSAGGAGGLGCASTGTPGTAIPPALASLPGRDGQPRGAVLADGGVVAGNDPGADGVANLGGVSAVSQAYGTLSAGGWLPSAGGDGQPGNPGQGGAGASDPYLNECPGPGLSGGGGGGGAGGCGGAGGVGGGGGGGSIALAAIGAMIDFRGVSLSTAPAGRGGPGGAGQDGQPGAMGGDNSLIDVEMLPFGHVQGAAGGNGAGGSGGAGGTGGISVGVLYDASTVVLLDAKTLLGAAIGPSGPGGTAGPAGRYQNGVLTTGADGSLGAAGSTGIGAPILQLR